MRKRIAGAGLTVLVAAGVVVYVSQARAVEPAPEPEALPTTAVTRGDLTSSVQQPGQLGYTGTHQLVGHRDGTLTALPAPGQMIDRGQPVYAVDQRPIPLLFGSVPPYRRLDPSTAGEDVRQLEQNLVDLGHAPNLLVDNTFSAATGAAVTRWQRALGVPQTGVLEAGDVVVAPGAARITTVEPVVGTAARPGEVIAAATGTGHGVRVGLDRRYRSLAAVDGPVRIQLFGGRAVDGVITSVGATAAAAEQDSRNPQQPATQAQTISVDIRITSAEADLGGVFEGPVTVTFPGETREDVLSVPIEALTLGSDGGYAVVVADGAGRRVVAVTTGLITSNRVEVEGVGEGTQVEVPSL